MVRMARLGLAMAPTLSLKVLTNFRFAIPTVYEQISTKSKLLKMKKKEMAAK